MKIFVILVSAYLIAGVHYVWRDLQMGVVHQPVYARDYALRGRVSSLVWAAVGWLPPALVRMRISSVLVFAVCAVAGIYLSSM